MAPPVTFLACGPTPLLNHFQQRLHHCQQAISFQDEITPQNLATLTQGDALLLINPPDPSAARSLANLAQQQALHFIEISTCDSPWAAQYGFLLHVAGCTDDLVIASPVLDALAPFPAAWWHVGYAGGAAFFNQLQQYTLLNPLGQENPLPAPELKISPQLHQACLDYLRLTEQEHFISCHPNRQCALASFLNKQDSPARQIARMMSLLPHD